MSRSRSRFSLDPVGVAVGFGAAVLGLLPGLFDGGRLPLQNLWREQVMSDQMPFALLPVSQYEATTILVLLVMGGVFAGLAARLIRRRRPVPAKSVAVGVLLVQGFAVVQSFAVVGDGLDVTTGSADSRAVLYFAGMLGGAVVSMLLAQFALWLTTRPSVALAALGFGLAAVPFASWVGVAAAALAGPTGYLQEVAFLLRWLPALIVGLALAWCSWRPARRLVVWVACLLALLVLPALFTAVSYALGMRVLDGDLAEMLGAAVQIFPVALQVGTWPVVVAAVIAVIGAVLRRTATRRPPAARRR